MQCQIMDLDEDRTSNCKRDAVLRVTYPTGAIGEHWYTLCLKHYIQCLREDVHHPDEFPENWAQRVQYVGDYSED